MTKTGSVLTAAVAGAVAWMVTMPRAAEATTSYTMTQDVRITMPDGVSLDSDEYVPNSGCPCPTILVQTPYRKSGGASVGEANPVFPQNGYAEIVVDVRGTGSSEGYWDSFGAKEQADSVTLVQWAAGRPFSNGVVGLAGASYGAINQFLTVEQAGTSAVQAIFPVVPMSDAYRDVTWSGGDVDAGFIPLWLGLVNGLNMIPAQDAASQPQIALNAESQHILDIAMFAGPAVADATLGAYESLLPAALRTFPEQAYDGPFYQLRSPIRKIGNVTVPTFIVGGEYDIFQRGEPILYNALNLTTAKKKLMLGPWYHTTAGNGLGGGLQDVKGNSLPDLNSLQVAWFDHWLKGVSNGIELFPTVETYYLGTGKWVPDTAYPATGTTAQRWYLSAAAGSGTSPLFAGSLSQSGDATDSTAILPAIPVNGTCSRSTTQWTAGLVSGTPCENDNRLTELLGLTFTTAPFAQAYALSGPIDATLWVSSTVGDTQLIATISDVAPNGSSSQITAGSLVASLRQVSTNACGSVVADCSVYAGGQLIEPWHPYTLASQSPLTPQTPTQLELEIFPTSAVIEAGHSLRLTITSADVPHMSATLSTAVNSAGGINTLYMGPDHPSSIYLGNVTPPPAT